MLQVYYFLLTTTNCISESVVIVSGNAYDIVYHNKYCKKNTEGNNELFVIAVVRSGNIRSMIWQLTNTSVALHHFAQCIDIVPQQRCITQQIENTLHAEQACVPFAEDELPTPWASRHK